MHPAPWRPDQQTGRAPQFHALQPGRSPLKLFGLEVNVCSLFSFLSFCTYRKTVPAGFLYIAACKTGMQFFTSRSVFESYMQKVVTVSPAQGVTVTERLPEAGFPYPSRCCRALPVTVYTGPCTLPDDSLIGRPEDLTPCRHPRRLQVHFPICLPVPFQNPFPSFSYCGDEPQIR